MDDSFSENPNELGINFSVLEAGRGWIVVDNNGQEKINLGAEETGENWAGKGSSSYDTNGLDCAAPVSESGDSWEIVDLESDESETDDADDEASPSENGQFYENLNKHHSGNWSDDSIKHDGKTKYMAHNVCQKLREKTSSEMFERNNNDLISTFGGFHDFTELENSDDFLEKTGSEPLLDDSSLTNEGEDSYHSRGTPSPGASWIEEPSEVDRAAEAWGEGRPEEPDPVCTADVRFCPRTKGLREMAWAGVETLRGAYLALIPPMTDPEDPRGDQLRDLASDRRLFLVKGQQKKSWLSRIFTNIKVEDVTPVGCPLMRDLLREASKDEPEPESGVPSAEQGLNKTGKATEKRWTRLRHSRASNPWERALALAKWWKCRRTPSSTNIEPE